MAWKKKWKYTDKVSLLVKFVKQISLNIDDSYYETFERISPLVLEIDAESKEDVIIRLTDYSEDHEKEYILYSTYCTPCQSLCGKPENLDKVEEILDGAIRFLSYLAKPCCDMAKKRAFKLFANRDNSIKNCPWCGVKITGV